MKRDKPERSLGRGVDFFGNFLRDPARACLLGVFLGLSLARRACRAFAFLFRELFALAGFFPQPLGCEPCFSLPM